MRIAIKAVLLTFLLASIVGNILLGTILYQRSEVSVSDYLVFQDFQSLLDHSVQLLDEMNHENRDKQVQTIQDFIKTKRQALGIIQGLTPEGTKRGINMENLMVDLYPELGNPSDPSFAATRDKLSQDLHLIQSKLKGVTYQGGPDFVKLKTAVNSIPKQ